MQKFKFVESVTGVSKAGRPYSFVKISDGYQTLAISNPKAIDFSKFTKGQDVSLEFEVTPGYKGDAQVTIAKVS